MTMIRILILLFVLPGFAQAVPNISLPHYDSFEGHADGSDLGYDEEKNCNGLDTGGMTADCSIKHQSTYPARYGDSYLEFKCEYDGNPAHRGLAMRAGNTNFEGFRDEPDCHIMYINDGTEYWIGWSNYIPSDYTGEKFSHASMQVAADNVSSPWNVVAQHQYGAEPWYEDGFKGRNRTNAYHGVDLADNWQQFKGEWVDLMLHVVWYDTDNAAAKFEMYLNGELEWERNGLQNIATGGNPVFGFCNYNWAFNQSLDISSLEYPNTAQTRKVVLDEFRFYQQEDGAGDNTYCDATPPIWAAAPTVTYPANNQPAIPTSFTALFSGYADHRTDLQSCFSYTDTQVQIDEYGGDWTTPVFDSTSAASQTQMSVTGLSGGATEYQIRVRHKSERVDSTDEYWGDWSNSHRFITADASDTTPPTWGSPEGITGATDDGTGGSIHVTVKACSDPSTPITYDTYYALESEWDPVFQNNSVWNNITNGWHITGLTNGSLYKFGITCSDSEGNEASTTVTATATPTSGTPDTLAVTGVSGSVKDGETLTITGTSFGATGPTVVMFDDFELGTLGANILTGAGSAKTGQWNTRSGSSYYGGDSLSGDKSFMSSYAAGYTNYIEALLPASTRNLFLSWWLKVPAGNNYPGEGTQDGANWKQMWIQGSSTTDDDLVVPTKTTTWAIDGNDEDPGYINWTTVSMNKGEWKRLWIWLKGSTTSSSADGEVKFWELTSSGVVQRENDINVNNLKATGEWERVRPNGWGRTTPNCLTAFDDIYIASGANAQARVEIGNAATYAGSTDITILTTTSWSDTSISATVNAGRFSQYDTGYLYVTDADGTVSNGYPITFESTQTVTVSGSGTPAVSGSGTPAIVGYESPPVVPSTYPMTYPIILE